MKALEKKPQSFPLLLASQHSARCHSECEKIAWHHIANELLIMNICRARRSRTLENLTLQTFLLAFKQRAFRMILRGQKAFGKRRRLLWRRTKTRGEILLQGKQGFQRLQKATDLGQKSVFFSLSLLYRRRLLCHFKI